MASIITSTTNSIDEVRQLFRNADNKSRTAKKATDKVARKLAYTEKSEYLSQIIERHPYLLAYFVHWQYMGSRRGYSLLISVPFEHSLHQPLHQLTPEAQAKILDLLGEPDSIPN